MGATVSSPKSLTRRQLLEMTQRPRDFVNQLFQIMIAQLTPKELLDLGNRAKCKDYVFVMADAIYKTFDAIKVKPTKDKTGVLFYKKITDVTKGVGGQQTYEHCLSLAYFYVRIFQIFGALAITVSDDPSSGQVLGYLQRPPERPTFGPPIPQIRGATAVPFRGGYISKGDNRDLDRRLESSRLNFIAPIIGLNKEDSNRYKLWHIRGSSHNAPVIGGYEQEYGSQYSATNVRYRSDELIISFGGVVLIYDAWIMDVPAILKVYDIKFNPYTLN
jgi:hypothetical protein